MFHHQGTKGEFNTNTLSDIAINGRPKESPEGKKFDEKFLADGWDIKHSLNSNDFQPSNNFGREVAFRVKDEKTGKMVEKRGLMEAPDDHQKTACFRLKGQEGEFNNNHIKDMAVNRTFDKKYEGWDFREGRGDYKLLPKQMEGKEVAFRVLDEKTGKMVEKRGMLRNKGQAFNNASFGLEGQSGEFNSNDIHEMAVNNKFGKTQEAKGWTVKGEDNHHDFAPAKLKGKEVAFRTLDQESGKVVDKRGVVLPPDNSEETAMFKLAGQKGEFNNNDIKEMAVNDTFSKEQKARGWTVKDDSNAQQFRPESLNGREVAFRQPDYETGEIHHHTGVVNTGGGLAAGLFSLVGLAGTFFNLAMISEMAFNPYMGMPPMGYMGSPMGTGIMI